MGLSPALERTLHAGNQAPSGENCQPWRFVVHAESVDVRLLPERDWSMYSRGQRASCIAIGCAIENIAIAASHEGYRADVHYFPLPDDPDLVATIALDKARPPSADPLAACIDARISNRKPYRRQPLDQEHRRALHEAAKQAAFGELRLVEDADGLTQLGRVGSTNEEVMLANRDMHRFFFSHLNWTPAEDARKSVGFYIKTLELPVPVRALFRLIRHWPAMRVLAALGFPRLVAKQNATLNASCSAIGALLMDSDMPLDYVRIGRTAQRVWLAATALGLSMQPLTGVLFMRLQMEDGESCASSARECRLVLDACRTADRLFDAGERRIAFMFRIGHGAPPSAHASRFPLEQVVTVCSFDTSSNGRQGTGNAVVANPDPR